MHVIGAKPFEGKQGAEQDSCERCGTEHRSEQCQHMENTVQSVMVKIILAKNGFLKEKLIKTSICRHVNLQARARRDEPECTVIS